MSQKFIKGYTNNHLTWVMVDATDFATPESALSAAMKIKIYGKLKSATGVNFVSSGTGSLTNDIQHVGASALGIYTIALAKADLSDASAAWYDQYVISLSSTGAAYQTLVVDGGIMESYLSGATSDTLSAAVALSDAVSNVYSLLSDHHSDFQSRVPKAVATNSQLSDLASDLRSYLVVMSGVQSDLYSLLSDHHSDFQSRVPKAVATNSQLSDLHSDLKSYLVLMSDTLSDLQSDFQSRVPKAVATNSQLSDLASDLRSFLVVMSGVQSDLTSALSDFQSDFQSRVPKRVATDSQLSDLTSDLKSYLVGMSGMLSDVQSQAVALSDAASTIYSALTTARGEPGTSAPAASKDIFGKVDYLYKFMRNKTAADAASGIVYNDDTTTPGQKFTHSDDGTTYTRNEVGTG